MILTISLVGGSAQAVAIFAAISAFMQTKSYGSLCGIMAMLSVIMTAFYFVLRPDPKPILKWGIVYFFVPCLLLLPHADVLLVERCDNKQIQKIDRIPIGIALPAYWASCFMVGMTKGIEAIFHTPQDMEYSRTGMLFGSALIRHSLTSAIPDASLQTDWARFIRQCVYMDIEVNRKYTWEALGNSSDILHFLAEQSMSSLRRVHTVQPIQGEIYPTCKALLPDLIQRFTQSSHHGIADLPSLHRAAVQKVFFQQSLQNSYQRYFNIAHHTSHIIRQNMVVNGLRQGVAQNATEENATAAALNYAYTQNQMQTTSMWIGIALQALEYIPMMHTILFLLMSVVGLLVLLIAMLPEWTFIVLKNYLFGFLYLAVWPILFTFINYIMTLFLVDAHSHHTGLYTGITLSNIDHVHHLHTRYAAISGYLLMMVPFIAPFIVRGGSSIMSHISHQTAAALASINGRTAQAVGSGDITHGNVNMDNMHYGNTQGYKTDTSVLYRTHGQTIQQGDGELVTQWGGQPDTFSNRERLSQESFSLNAKETRMKILREALQQSQQQTESRRETASSALQESSQKLWNWVQKVGADHTYGDHWSTHTESQYAQTVQDIAHVVRDTAKTQGTTESTAVRRLLGAYIGGNVGIDSRHSALGTAAKWLLGTGVQLQTGVQSSKEQVGQKSHTHATMQHASTGEQEQFNRMMHHLKKQGRSTQSAAQYHEGEQQAESVMQQLTESEDKVAQWAQDQQKTAVLAATKEYAEQHHLDQDENLMPAFQAYLDARYTDAPWMVGRIMRSETKEMEALRMEAVRDFMGQRYQSLASIKQGEQSCTLVSDHPSSENGTDLSSNQHQIKDAIQLQRQWLQARSKVQRESIDQVQDGIQHHIEKKTDEVIREKAQFVVLWRKRVEVHGGEQKALLDPPIFLVSLSLWGFLATDYP